MQGVWKLVLVSALFAAQTLSSPVQRREETKGSGRLLTEAQPLAAAKAPTRLEQSEHREDAPAVQRMELDSVAQSQIREEAPVKSDDVSKRYEARPQVVVAREEHASKVQVSATEQRAIDERIEQQPQQRVEYDTVQQVEIRGESNDQRRLDESNYEEQRELVVPPPGQAEPYAFSYQSESSSRRESSDTNGVVRGQYTIQGLDGPSRVVDYVADQDGFRATVVTNEFGTEAKSAADVILRTSQPNAEDITLRLEGKTRREEPPAGVKGPAPVREIYELPVKTLEAPVRPLEVPAPIALKAPLVPVPAPVPVKAPVVQVEEANKISRRVDVVEENRASGKSQQRVSQEEQQESAAPVHLASEPVPPRSAQLRSPRAQAVQPRLFESASSHRTYRPAPSVVVHREPNGSFLRAPVPASHHGRGHSHVHAHSHIHSHGRYPPSPVHGYRRQQVALMEPVVRINPRAPFYGPAPVPGFEETFEHPDA